MDIATQHQHCQGADFPDYSATHITVLSRFCKYVSGGCESCAAFWANRLFSCMLTAFRKLVLYP